MPVMDAGDRQGYVKTVIKKATMQSTIVKEICFIHICFIINFFIKFHKHLQDKLFLIYTLFSLHISINNLFLF